MRCLVHGDYEGLKLASRSYDEVAESWLVTYVMEYSTGTWNLVVPDAEINNHLPPKAEALNWLAPLLHFDASPKIALLSLLRP